MTPQTAEEVISWCANRTVPVGVTVPVAIEAHKRAPDGFTFRAVLLAMIPDTEDAHQQFDYLMELPVEAWPTNEDYSREEIRTETLANMSRNLTWRRSCN